MCSTNRLILTFQEHFNLLIHKWKTLFTGRKSSDFEYLILFTSGLQIASFTFLVCMLFLCICKLLDRLLNLLVYIRWNKMRYEFICTRTHAPWVKLDSARVNLKKLISYGCVLLLVATLSSRFQIQLSASAKIVLNAIESDLILNNTDLMNKRLN